MSITDLSLKLNSSATNITYHLKKLISKGIILGFIPQINYSALNLQYTKVVTVSELSTYKILNSGTVLLTEGAVEKIENILS